MTNRPKVATAVLGVVLVATLFGSGLTQLPGAYARAMPETLWWAGLLLLAAAFLVVQRRFYAIHVRKKGWQPNPWRSFFTFPSDVDRMTWRRDEDPDIERARRIYLATLVAWCVLAAAGLLVQFLAGVVRP